MGKPIALPDKTLCAQTSDTELARFRASGVELLGVTVLGTEGLSQGSAGRGKPGSMPSVP